MTERERLIELLNNVGGNVLEFPTNSFIESLADYLLANGVIVPPCRVGDTVYVVPTKDNEMRFVEARKITYVLEGASGKHYCSVDSDYKRKNYRSKEYAMTDRMFGKTVFLAREEAELALKNLRKEHIS